MTKEEFKKRWESDDNGGGITFEEVAECAINWKISSRPRINSMDLLLYRVLKYVGVSDYEDYKPKNIK